MVLDVWPVRGGGDFPQLYADLLVAGHTLLTLDVGPEEIRVSALEQERLRPFLDNGSMRLPHTLAGDHLVAGFLPSPTSLLFWAMNRKRSHHLVDQEEARRPSPARPPAR